MLVTEEDASPPKAEVYCARGELKEEKEVHRVLISVWECPSLSFSAHISRRSQFAKSALK